MKKQTKYFIKTTVFYDFSQNINHLRQFLRQLFVSFVGEVQKQPVFLLRS